MSKAKEEYENLKTDEEYYSMEGMDTAAEYIEKLKKQNEEMKRLLSILYDGDDGRLDLSEINWIEEVLKDE